MYIVYKVNSALYCTHFIISSLYCMHALRPHHILCMLNFQGKGYTPTFVENFCMVQKDIQNNPHQPFTVQYEADSICAACPHLKKSLNRQLTPLPFLSDQQNSSATYRKHLSSIMHQPYEDSKKLPNWTPPDAKKYVKKKPTFNS